jgi:hypothetical protein
MMVSSMGERVFKRNRTIMLKIFKKHVPNPSEEQLFTFIADMRNMTVLYKKILSENLFVSNIPRSFG